MTNTEMTAAAAEVTLPEILTANTYFWRPGSSASSRRSNEQRRHAEVQRFLDVHAETLAAAGVTVEFSYSESCNNVYKRVEVYRNGKKSNLTAVKKALGIK